MTEATGTQRPQSNQSPPTEPPVATLTAPAGPARAPRRSAGVTVGAMLLAAASLTACSSGPDYAGVCVDKRTQRRVDDRDCNDRNTRGGTHGWWYVGRGGRLPAIGGAVVGSGGSFTAPRSGSVSRGGFGRSGGKVGG